MRSFYDSNGDGKGDINGIIEKLDYLNDGDPQTTSDLGVNALWLMPIQPSPSYHGYDITDYYNVNPDYGTLQDFQRLMEEAHKRGIRVIIDFVANHTSVEHPWFQQAKEHTIALSQLVHLVGYKPKHQRSLGTNGLASCGGRTLFLRRLLGRNARPQLQKPSHRRRNG